MQLHLIRHPKPEVAADTCYGSTDLAVSAQENTRVLQQLIQTLPTPTLLLSSPLQRCATFARSLAEACGWASPVIDQRLAELDFGVWEMQPWDAIPRAEIDAWANAPIDYQPGGGESVMQMAARVSAFYLDVLRGDFGNHPDDNIIVICHAGTIRLLLACQGYSADTLVLADVADLAASKPHAIAYGGVMSFSC